MVRRRLTKRTEVPNADELIASGERLPRDSAVALIASRLSDRGCGDNERFKRQRVQSAMRYDIRKGRLSKPGRSGFELAEVVEWARQHFRKDRARFDDLARALRKRPAEARAQIMLEDVTVTAHAEGLPATLDECLQRIRESDAEVARLTAIEIELRRHIAELEPDARRLRELKRQRG